MCEAKKKELIIKVNEMLHDMDSVVSADVFFPEPQPSGQLLAVADCWAAYTDGGPIFLYTDMSAEEAAEEYAEPYRERANEELMTTTVRVAVWRPALVMNFDDQVEDAQEVRFDEQSFTFVFHPDEPSCDGGDEHDWRYEGCRGEGPGVVSWYSCPHCTWAKVTQTLADDGYGGTCTRVRYEREDEDEEVWSFES